jgi:hypothetical protein
LPDRIVHAHFREAAVARFFICFGLGTGRLSSLQRRFHVFDLEPKMIDALTPATRRQHRHVDVAVGQIDRPITVLAHRTAPCFGHPEGLFVKLRGLFLIFHLDRDVLDSCHVIPSYDLYSFSTKPLFLISSRILLLT